MSEPVWLNPDNIRFSQNTIGGPTRLAGEWISVPELVNQFREHRYVSEPVDVVRMPDGGLFSLDNRRLFAAQEAGLPEICGASSQPRGPLRRTSFTTKEPDSEAEGHCERRATGPVQRGRLFRWAGTPHHG